MCYDNDGHAVFPAAILQELQDRLAGIIVKCAGGLIAEQELRIFRKRTCDGNTLLFTAYLRTVPKELDEAALMDGAGRFKQAIHVTLPAILPTVAIMLIMAIGSLLSVGYEKIILLYNGSTYETADVISTYVYRKGIQGADYSYSTAVGLFQSVIGLIFIWGANKFSAVLTETSLW